MAKRTTKRTMKNRQTSRKAGMKSLAQKEDDSRYGFGTPPPSRKVAGASGQEGRGRGRQGSPSAPRGGKRAAIKKMKAAKRRVRRSS